MKKLLLVLMSVILIVPAFSKADELEDELAALQRRIKDTQKKIEQEKSYRKALQGQYKDASQNWLQAKTELDTINNRINDLNASIVTTRKDIASTKTKIATKGVEVDKKRKDIGQLLTVIHKYRNTRFVDYVFSANDFSELLTRNRLMNQLLKGAMEAIVDLKDESVKLVKLREDLKNKEKSLNDLLAQVKQDKQRTINLQNYQANLMVQINNSTAQSKMMEDNYERQMTRDSEAIKAVLIKIQERDRQRKNPIVWHGQFTWPLDHPKIVGSAAEYGWRIHPIYGDRRFHYGLDIDAPLGTSVKACADGRIEWASWNGGYGNCVMIYHGDGWATVYGHLSAYRCRVGDMVKQGQVIALCGSTGLSTEPHVHLEIRHNGSTVSPRANLPPLN